MRNSGARSYLRPADISGFACTIKKSVKMSIGFFEKLCTIMCALNEPLLFTKLANLLPFLEI